MTEWKSHVTRLLEERIKILTHKYLNIRSSTSALKSDIIKRSLDGLNDDFVIEPIDKAHGSIAVICKRFYM